MSVELSVADKTRVPQRRRWRSRASSLSWHRRLLVTHRRDRHWRGQLRQLLTRRSASDRRRDGIARNPSRRLSERWRVRRSSAVVHSGACRPTIPASRVDLGVACPAQSSRSGHHSSTFVNRPHIGTRAGCRSWTKIVPLEGDFAAAPTPRTDAHCLNSAVCSRRPCGFFDDARAVRGPNADHSRGTAARPIRLRDRVDDSGSPVALDDGKHGSPESASE